MNISIIGTGFVGLITGACLAKKNKIVCVDIDKKRVQKVNQAKSPFYEKNLDELLKKAVAAKKLKATTDLKKAVLKTDLTLISVGTPMKADGSNDLSYVEKAAAQIGAAISKKQKRHTVVVRSTVVPGTTRNLVGEAIQKKSLKKAGEGFGLAMQPEFLREGNAVEDTLKPDKIVIGSLDKKTDQLLTKLYKNYYGKNTPKIIHCSPETAELIKYANNGFLATKISYINEIANICQKIPGVDVSLVAEAMGLDKRINPSFLKAGCGFGGSCFPKDVSALANYAAKKSSRATLLESVLKVNKKQPLKTVELLEKKLGKLSIKTVAILGLSFKPGTDDMREAPSITIINELLKKKTRIKAYDPKAKKEAEKIFGKKIIFCENALRCLEKTDACIIVTDWQDFKKLSDKDFAKMNKPLVIDCRRILDPKKIPKTTYVGTGLGE